MKTVIPIKVVKGEPPASDGWRPLSTLSEPRLSEMAENYKALGYEVEIRDIQKAEGSCTSCFDAGTEIGQVFGTLWVRRQASNDTDNELYE